MSHSTRMRGFRQRQWIEQGKRCHYCHRELPLDETTIEHVVPKVYGGPDGVYNLVITCEPCNQERGHGLIYCGCERCTAAVSTFMRLRRGQRQPVQSVVYVGDKRDVAEAVEQLQGRRDKLLRHAANTELDHDSRLAAKAAAHAYDQAIGLLVTPVPAPASDPSQEMAASAAGAA